MTDGMLYYQRNQEFFAQVAGGIEELAAVELEALGARDLRIVTRGIIFCASLQDLYRINYRSRLVTRVLAPLLKFEATTPEQESCDTFVYGSTPGGIGMQIENGRPIYA